MDHPTAPERVETPRLVLKRPAAGDAADIFVRFSADPEVTRLLGWPTHRTVDDARAFLEFSDHEWQRWPAGPYLIVSREDGTLLGSTGLSFDTPYRASTGYVLARAAWGRGYATEALRAIVEVAGDLGVRRLYALCHPDHRPSWHVLEKAGFVREALMRAYSEFPNLEPGVPQDVLCYVQLVSPRSW